MYTPLNLIVCLKLIHNCVSVATDEKQYSIRLFLNKKKIIIIINIVPSNRILPDYRVSVVLRSDERHVFE